MRWQKPWLRGCWISTAVCCHCMCCKMLIAWIGRTPIRSLRGSEGLLLFRCGGCTCKVITSALKSQFYSVQQDIYLAQKSVGCILYTLCIWFSVKVWMSVTIPSQPVSYNSCSQICYNHLGKKWQAVSYNYGGTLWRSWLVHCPINRKVTGLITYGVTGIFHWHNPSGCTVALWSTQPLTEMSSRNISWGVKTASA